MGKNIKPHSLHYTIYEELTQDGIKTSISIMFLWENIGEYLHDCGRQRYFR